MKQRSGKGFLYSFASFGTSLTSFTVSTYIGFFYITVIGLSPRWVGWGLFAFSWWNALNDPLVGWLSDRTHSRWGRRMPYVLFLSIPLGLSFWAVWTPPTSPNGSMLTFVFMIAAIAFNDLLYTMVSLSSAALLPEMFPALSQRARVNGWRQIMSTLGMLIAVIVPPIVAAQMGWGAVGALIGALASVSLLISVRGMVESGRYSEARGPGLLESARRVVRSRSCVVVLGMGFLIRLSLTTLNAGMPFYASYVLGLGASGTAWLLGTALVVSLLTTQVWARVLARWGARTTALVAQLLAGLALLLFLRVGTLQQALFAAGLTGVCLAGLLIVPEVLLSDVADEDHVRSGYRHEGVFFGAANLVNRLPNMLQALGIGELLSLAGFDAGLTTQPHAVATGLRLLVGVVPGAALLLGSALTLLYPLHGEVLARMRDELELAGLSSRSSANGLPLDRTP